MRIIRLCAPAACEGAFWPEVEACYSRTWKGYMMAPHCHPRAEIMYVLKNKCVIRLFSPRTDPATGEIHLENEQVRRLGIGEFIWIDAGVWHTLEVPETCYMVNTEFRIQENPQAALSLRALKQHSQFFRQWMDRHPLFACAADPDGALYAILASIVDHFDGFGEDEKIIRDLRMGQMLLIIAQAIEANSQNAGAIGYVRRAVRMLHEGMEEKITVNQIARELGISDSYLQKIFKQAQGVSIIDYLNRIRIEKSKILLAHTDEPVVDIAMAAGYHSRQYFSRVFTQLTGQSPQQYRKTMKEAENKEIWHF